MEDIGEYRRIIRDLILEYAALPKPMGDVDTEVVFDEEHDHYELVHNGWAGPYRIQGPVIHMDIRDGKVWIQHDGTPDALADRLVEAGIPKDRIVLAFKAPSLRQHTGFAVASLCHPMADSASGAPSRALSTTFPQLA